MALKRNDKIIAIIGVIILIIAGVAIFLYSSPEEETPVVIKEKTYTYTWVSTEENQTFTDTAQKNKEYLTDITIELGEGNVLTDVNFWIKWKDDRTRGILFNKGEDKLTATIKYGDQEETHKSTKSADASIVDFMINDVPQEEVFTTDDEEFDPIQYINQKYFDQNKATFSLSVKVVTGEKLLTLRPLKLLNWLLDQGNKFNLIITYRYYSYDYEEFLEDNIPPTGGQGDNGGTYSHLTYTGFK